MIQVKRFVAPTYAEALIKAKNELGNDALIVDSKKIRVGGFLGLFQRSMTELTVAVDRPDGPTSSSAWATSAAPLAGVAAPQVQPAPANAAPLPSATAASLERELASLRRAVSQLVEQKEEEESLSRLTSYGRHVYETLVDRGVEPAAALELSLGLTDESQGQVWLQTAVTRMLGPFQQITVAPGQRRIAALVGPTGVGKTTTLAKLAAHFALNMGKKVGLITSDSYRIAAIEQLKTYGDILGIPLNVADTPEDMVRALKDTADCDIVLVDTGGRNHKDAARMAELRETLAVLRPDETHLVVSLTANPRDAYEWLDYYGPLGVNRLLFTKLDEAASPGLMLNLRRRCQYPVGYITYGQSVPDDIMPADRADFAQILLGA